MPIIHKTIFTLIVFHSLNLCFGQSYQEALCDVFLSGGPTPVQDGNFFYQTDYSASGSSWELDWDEINIYHSLLSYNNPDNDHQSYEMRIGKGGQIYSFKNPIFGEALPPQWRPSFDELGNRIADQIISSPVNTHHGNWAPWNDEVWQLVGSDQRDSINGSVKTQNIHMAGSYLNNFANRASDHTETPFYSPMVQSYYSLSDQSLTTIVWGQSENPIYVYNAPEGCDACYEELFRPSVLFFQRYKPIGQGIIQIDFLIYNYSRTRGIDFWNVPFTGIRNSNLPYGIISSSATDETQYEVLNTKIGHPAADNPSTEEDESEGYLPPFNQGTIRITSGNNSVASGWMAFSSQPEGEGSTLAFVTAKNTINPINARGDLRYGTAMSNAIRDVTIFTRRANAGPINPATGLKPWGIVNGQSIQGRYFIVVDANIDSVVQQIQNRNLVSEARIEIVSIPYDSAKDIHYRFADNGSNIYSAVKTTPSLAQYSFNSKPFDGSYPVFIISTSSESILSSNPYYFSLRPYDGTVQSIELLGYSDTPQQIQLNQLVLSTVNSNLKKGAISIYPNPTDDVVNIVGKGIQSIDLSIYNVLGQDVSNLTSITNTEANKVIINVSKLDAGIYFIKIKGAIVNIMHKK